MVPNIRAIKYVGPFEWRETENRLSISAPLVPSSARLAAKRREPTEFEIPGEIGDNLATTGNSYISIFAIERTRRYKTNASA